MFFNRLLVLTASPSVVISLQTTDKISLVTERSALRLRDAMAWRLAATSRSRKVKRVNPRKHPKSSFPRVVRCALFSALKSVRPSANHIPRVSYPHSPSHSHILRPHVRLTTATSLSIPFIVPVPISRCALHLVPPTDTPPILTVPHPVLIVVLRFCGHRAQCSQPLTSFVLLFIVCFSRLQVATVD
jgi:hypothetical protein